MIIRENRIVTDYYPKIHEEFQMKKIDEITTDLFKKNRLFLIGDERKGVSGFFRRLINRLLQPLFKRQSEFNSNVIEAVKYLDENEERVYGKSWQSLDANEVQVERLKTKIILLENRIDKLEKELEEQNHE